MPNNASPAPPNTGNGSAAMMAPTLGKSPSTKRIPPLTATTNRLLIPVSATSPTFCAKALTGKPLSRPPETAVDSVSARSPFATVLRSAGRPTTTPIASRSAVVSVMITSITMIMDTMAAASKVGAPKWNGVEIAKPCASDTGEKSTLPKIAATTPPASRPIRIAIREKNPGRNR